jgi:hypothetical protein
MMSYQNHYQLDIWFQCLTIGGVGQNTIRTAVFMHFISERWLSILLVSDHGQLLATRQHPLCYNDFVVQFVCEKSSARGATFPLHYPLCTVATPGGDCEKYYSLLRHCDWMMGVVFAQILYSCVLPFIKKKSRLFIYLRWYQNWKPSQ